MEWKIPAAVIVAAVLVIITAGTLILAVQSPGETARSGQPDTVTLSTIPPRTSTPITTQALNNTAATLPATLTVTPPVPDSSPEKSANGCSLVANRYGYIYYNTSVFNAESAGKYSDPAREKEPGITTGQAEDIVMKAFREYSPDSVGMKYEEGTSNSPPLWKFDLYKDEQQVALGDLYPDGEIMSYSIPGEDNRVKYHMRPDLVPTPAISLESARVTAENEIRERNGELPLKMMVSELSTGNYFFVYHRIIHGVPSANNYVSVCINPGTGKVSDYTKYWWTPENAVAAQTVPAISREEAIAVVERTAKPCYQESADSFRIIAADLQWMDVYNDNEFTPKPGVIPLGWYVRFDDKTIREMNNRHEGEAWVDAQNGTLLSLYYIHNGS